MSQRAKDYDMKPTDAVGKLTFTSNHNVSWCVVTLIIILEGSTQALKHFHLLLFLTTIRAISCVETCRLIKVLLLQKCLVAFYSFFRNVCNMCTFIGT